MDNQYARKGNSFVDLETGEILTANELLDKKLDELEDTASSASDLAYEAGKKLNIRISTTANRETKTVPIKNNYNFQKVFQSSLDALFKMTDFSVPALAFMMRVIPYIKYPSNCLILNSRNPTVEEMGKLLGITRKTMTIILNELETKDVIRRVKDGKTNIIFFNPFLICAGKVVERECYELFKDSLFNTHL